MCTADAITTRRRQADRALSWSQLRSGGVDQTGTQRCLPSSLASAPLVLGLVTLVRAAGGRSSNAAIVNTGQRLGPFRAHGCFRSPLDHRGVGQALRTHSLGYAFVVGIGSSTKAHATESADPRRSAASSARGLPERLPASATTVRPGRCLRVSKDRCLVPRHVDGGHGAD